MPGFLYFLLNHIVGSFCSSGKVSIQYSLINMPKDQTPQVTKTYVLSSKIKNEYTVVLYLFLFLLIPIEVINYVVNTEAALF